MLNANTNFYKLMVLSSNSKNLSKIFEFDYES